MRRHGGGRRRGESLVRVAVRMLAHAEHGTSTPKVFEGPSLHAPGLTGEVLSGTSARTAQPSRWVAPP